MGAGFPACIPQAGKPIDWCVDLENVEFFQYPNALPGPYWDVEFFHGHGQFSDKTYRKVQAECGAPSRARSCRPGLWRSRSCC